MHSIVRPARRGWYLALLIALAVVVPACTADIAGGKADGALVFQEACARCHGERGAPPAQLATTLRVRDLTATEFGQRATLDGVRAQVRDGSASKVMPGFGGRLSDAQIDAVAAYVLTLDGVP